MVASVHRRKPRVVFDRTPFTETGAHYVLATGGPSTTFLVEPGERPFQAGARLSRRGRSAREVAEKPLDQAISVSFLSFRDRDCLIQFFFSDLPSGPAAPAQARARLEGALARFDQECRRRAASGQHVSGPGFSVQVCVDHTILQRCTLATIANRCPA